MSLAAILPGVRGIHCTCAALAVAAALAAAPPAFAQGDDDVYVNPNSPSGVEYDLPLERARRDAGDAPSNAPVARGTQSSAPFGAGITGPAGSAASKSGARRSSSTRERDAKLPPEVVEAAARPVAPGGTSGSELLYGGIGALVVAAGALIGFAVRRLNRS
jgi:hypothetical protein